MPSNNHYLANKHLSWCFREGNNVFAGEFCGILSGQHMYLDAGGVLDREEIRVFITFDPTATGNRVFKFLVSYIPCGKPYTPDPGCRQYYMGASGTATSYNFEGNNHMNIMSYT